MASAVEDDACSDPPENTDRRTDRCSDVEHRACKAACSALKKLRRDSEFSRISIYHGTELFHLPRNVVS